MKIFKLDYQKQFILFLTLSFLFSVERIDLPPENFDNWIKLQSNHTWIGWAEYDGFPICKAVRTLPFNIDNISIAIEDKKNYPNIFERITQVRLYEKDVLHIYLDMPFPISSRDYIVKYEYIEKNNQKNYKFFSVDHQKTIEFKDAIRLPNAGGEWILIPLNANSTEVSYIWNGELLGDFPNWALTNAWKTQGTEVLDWLNSALNRNNN